MFAVDFYTDFVYNTETPVSNHYPHCYSYLGCFFDCHPGNGLETACFDIDLSYYISYRNNQDCTVYLNSCCFYLENGNSNLSHDYNLSQMNNPYQNVWVI